MARKSILKGTQRKKTSARWKPSITIVGPGRLGSALAIALHEAGYRVNELVAREPRKVRALAATIRSTVVSLDRAEINGDIVWLTVGDSAVRGVAEQLASHRQDWSGKTVFHSSGALTSDELGAVRDGGAAVASVHPLMTFSGGKPPSLDGVAFALEGEPHAVRVAEKIVRTLGGNPLRIDAKKKAAYHAWATFGSPLVIALLAAAEKVASAAGLKSVDARRAIAPLTRQTVENYVANGGDSAFTGALIRGDIATVAKHLEVLRNTPAVREAYVALARASITVLPVRNAAKIAKLLARSEPRTPRMQR